MNDISKNVILLMQISICIYLLHKYFDIKKKNFEWKKKSVAMIAD